MSLERFEKTSVEELRKLPIVGSQPKDEKEENFLREICEYEFYNLEEPGVSVRFPYGDSHSHHVFTLFHGGKYRVPRFLAQHIESKSTPIWEWRPDGIGGLTKKLIGHNPRFQMRQVFGG